MKLKTSKLCKVIGYKRMLKIDRRSTNKKSLVIWNHLLRVLLTDSLVLFEISIDRSFLFACLGVFNNGDWCIMVSSLSANVVGKFKTDCVVYGGDLIGIKFDNAIEWSGLSDALNDCGRFVADDNGNDCWRFAGDDNVSDCEEFVGDGNSTQADKNLKKRV